MEATARLDQAGEQPGCQSAPSRTKLLYMQVRWLDLQDRVVAMAFQLLQAMWNKDYQVCSYAQPPQ